jgi:hypothetical protein
MGNERTMIESSEVPEVEESMADRDGTAPAPYFGFTDTDVTRALHNYIRDDWQVRYNQLLRIQDQYMPRGRYG